MGLQDFLHVSEMQIWKSSASQNQLRKVTSHLSGRTGKTEAGAVLPHLRQALNDFAHWYLSGTSAASRQGPLESDPCYQPAANSKAKSV